MTKQSSRAVRSVLADISECYRDVTNWPNVDESIIKDAVTLKRFKRLTKAMEAYLQGNTLSEAAAIAQLSRNRFLKLLRRCLTSAPDGRIWGCRALILGARVKILERKKSFTKQENANAGFQGMFGRLLTLHPEIEQDLRKCLKRKNGGLKLNKATFRAIHKKFLESCEQAHVGLNEYPFNTIRQAREPLRNWIKTHFLRAEGEAWTQSVHGDDAAQAYGYQDGDGQAMRAYGPYRVWIIDETPIDQEATYELPSARGDWEEIELRRPSAIRTRDAGTGANLASRVVLAPQASAEDISLCLQAAILGSGRTNCGDGNVSRAGYPSDVIAELRYAVPELILLDNALSHLSDHLQHTCLFLFGGRVRLGQPHTPQERAPVEASFSAIARRLLHQLPGTTGSGPEDPVRQTAAVAPKDRIRVDQLVDAIDTYCANENALPAAASHYISPLERLRRQLASGALQPVYLLSTKRHPHYFCKADRRTVRSNGKSGRRPHVNYEGVRYSSSLLSKSFSRVGCPVWVRADFNDLRTILIFDIDGKEIGPLNALGEWRKFPHDIRIRKLFLALKKKNELGPRADDDPLATLFDFLRRRASGDRTVALQLTHIVEYLRRQAEAAGVQLAEEYESWEEASEAAREVGLLPQLDPSRSLPPLSASADNAPAKITERAGESKQDVGAGTGNPTLKSNPPSFSELDAPILYVRPLERRLIRR
jgi:putative transposase